MKIKTKTYFKIALLPAILITATLAGITSCNNSQKPDASLTSSDSTKSDTIKTRQDAQFLAKVSGINLEEIKLGQLAQQKSTMPDVKDLGKMMEEEHTKAQNDLTTLASKKSITIPTTLDSNAQNDYHKLNNLSGSDFDKQYCDMMVSGHKAAIVLFKQEFTDARDTDIRQMAAITLPTLQKHLDHALACQKQCEKM